MADHTGRRSQSATGGTTNQDKDTGVGKGKATTPDQNPVEGDSPQPDQQLPSRRSDGQQESSGEADSVEFTITGQGFIGPVSKDKGNGKDYMIHAKRSFDELLQKLQCWCCFQSLQHEDDVEHYEGLCHKLEIFSAFWGGTAALSSMLIFNKKRFLKGLGKLTRSNDEQKVCNGIKRLVGINKWIGVVGVGGFGVLQYLSHGTATLLPSIQKRADDHREVLFGWDSLKQKVKATRIELRNADMNIDKLSSKYMNHINEFEKLGQRVLVRKSTLEKSDEREEEVEANEHTFLKQWPADCCRPTPPKTSDEEKNPA